MSCSYCSVEGADHLPKMSLSTVDKIFERVTDFCGKNRHIYLIWHGGEPLLMGPFFYEYIGQKTEEYSGYKIINSIQSNSTLIDEEFIDIIKKYNYRYSTSLDGPADIHNVSRRFKNGDPTFGKIMDSIIALKSRNIPVGVITVLNNLNKNKLPELYEFLNEKEIHMRINPVLYHGSALEHKKRVIITPKEYGEKMINLFDIWYHDPDTRIMIDPYRIIIGNIITGNIHSCEFRKQCHKDVLSIGPKGGVYPCGQFSGNENYYLGNIHKQDFFEIMATPSMEKLLSRGPENIETCFNCEYKEICNSGCTASAVCRNGDIMQPDYYCIGRKMLFHHIIESLQEDINKTILSKEHIMDHYSIDM